MQRRRVASRGNGIAEKKAHFAGDTSGGTEIKVQPGLTRDSYATDDAARASSRVVFTACGYVMYLFDRHFPNYVLVRRVFALAATILQWLF